MTNVAGLLSRGRLRAEVVMVDACTVEEVTTALNPATGDMVETPTTLYTGKCRIRSAWDITERQAGEAEQPVTRPALLIPHSADDSGFGAGCRVTVTGDAAGVYTMVGQLKAATTATARSWLLEYL